MKISPTEKSNTLLHGEIKETTENESFHMAVENIEQKTEDYIVYINSYLIIIRYFLKKRQGVHARLEATANLKKSN